MAYVARSCKVRPAHIHVTASPCLARAHFVLLIFVALLAGPELSSVRADVIFTTLSSTGTYDPNANMEVNGNNASGTLYAANAFQPMFDGNLLSIRLGITNYDIRDGGLGDIVLHLYANDTTTNTPVT